MITIETFVDWGISFSIQLTILTLSILLVQRLFRSKLTAKWRYWLWMLLIIRMLLPITIPSPTSVFNLLKFSKTIKTEKVVTSAKIAMTPKAEVSYDNKSAEVNTNTVTEENLVTTVPTSSIEFHNTSKEPISPKAWILYIWLSGVILLSLKMVISVYRFSRSIRRNRPVTDQEIINLLEDCKEEIGIQIPIDIVESTKTKTPALLGFIRPRILLPKQLLNNFDTEELRYVFLHELAHLKNNDIQLNWLTSLLQTLHWFNPLIWLVMNKVRSERELVCDNSVLKITTGENHKYGEVMIKLLEFSGKTENIPAVSGILENKKELKRRIKMIAQYSKTKSCTLLALMLTMFITAFGMTDAMAKDKQPTSNKQVTAAPRVVKTFPMLGDKNVDPSTTQITVTFDQDMQTNQMWSWCYESKDKFPQLDPKTVKFINKRTCVADVKLEADKEYVIWFNTQRFKSFRGVNKKPAQPYRLIFHTAKKKKVVKSIKDYQLVIDQLTKLLETDNPQLKKVVISHKLSEDNQLTINLHRGNRELKDISAFQKFTSKELPINEINLGRTNVTDISPLIHFDIKLLCLGIGPFRNFKQLRDFKCEKLYLCKLNMKSSDLEHIIHMPLTLLWLTTNKGICDISLLSKLKKLDNLSLSATSVSDITVLKNLPLHSLLITDTKTTDITPLKNILTLKRLWISGLESDGLKVLEKLDLECLRTRTPNIDLEPISHMSIDELWIVGHYKTLPTFKQNRLKTLGIRDKSMKDLKIIKKFKELNTLWLMDTSLLTDLSELKNVSVNSLVIWECNPKIDLSVLNKCNNLFSIKIPDYVNISPLKNHPSLKMIKFGNKDKFQTMKEFWEEQSQMDKKGSNND